MKQQKRKRLTITDVYGGLMDLTAAVELGFTKMEERFEARISQSEKATWRRLDAHDDRFDAIDKRFAAVDQRFDALEQRFDARFVAVDRRFDALEQRFDARFDRLEDRVGSLELRPAR
jgi:hypothetical protein